MTKTEYEKAKQEIFDRASKRSEEIIKKYAISNSEEDKSSLKGQLDGVPWAQELRQDSKKVLQELEDLDKKYNK